MALPVDLQVSLAPGESELGPVDGRAPLALGASSEKLERSIAQLELALEEIEASEAAASAEAPVHSEPPTRRLRPVRTPPPEHLPREAASAVR